MSEFGRKTDVSRKWFAPISDLRIPTFLEGCLMGVEPIPSGSQPGVQKPLHHKHHAEFGMRRSE